MRLFFRITRFGSFDIKYETSRKTDPAESVFPLRGKTLPALLTAALQDQAAALRLHALAETVRHLAVMRVRLICTLQSVPLPSFFSRPAKGQLSMIINDRLMRVKRRFLFAVSFRRIFLPGKRKFAAKGEYI